MTSTGLDLYSDDDSGGSLNALIGTYTLPETAAYYVTAQTPASQPASGHFVLWLEKAHIEPLTSSVQGEMVGETLYYSFEASVGDRISIHMESDPTLDTLFNLTTKEGIYAAWDDDSGDGLAPEFVNLALEWDGSYILSIQPVTATMSGPFTLTLTRREAQPLTFDEVQTVTFGNKQNQQAFTVDAQAGETLRVTFTTGNLTQANLNINIWQDGEIISSTFFDQAFPEWVAEAQIPADGEVRIVLTDYNYRTHTYEMLVERQ